MYDKIDVFFFCRVEKCLMSLIRALSGKTHDAVGTTDNPSERPEPSVRLMRIALMMLAWVSLTALA